MNQEILNQILAYDKQYSADLDALILYTLHVHCGWGQKRLRAFWEAVKVEHDKLVEYYSMPDDGPWLCRRMLLDIGVDVEAWNDELKAEEGR